MSAEHVYYNVFWQYPNTIINHPLKRCRQDSSQGAAVGALLGPGGVVVLAMVTSRALCLLLVFGRVCLLLFAYVSLSYVPHYHGDQACFADLGGYLCVEGKGREGGGVCGGVLA